MVQHIEHLRPELQTKRFMYWEISVESEIPLHGPKTAQEISRHIPLPKRLAAGAGWVCERRRIECFPARVLRTIKVAGLPGNQVRTNQRAETGQVSEFRVGNADWLRRSHLDDIFRRPTSQ